MPKNSVDTRHTELLQISTVAGCELLNLPRFADDRGVLSFVEGGNHVPFPIARIFYLYGVPHDSVRAAHALKTCAQLVIAVNGSFDVMLNDGITERWLTLDDPAKGLMIPPKIWREISGFSEGCVCLVLASDPYDADGYYAEYDEYLQAVGRAK